MKLRRLAWRDVSLCLGLFVAGGLAQAQQEVAPGGFLVGHIQNRNIAESSGLIATHRAAGAYWTHNDGNDGIFSLTREGLSLGHWKISGVRTEDFEDIAWSPGRLYFADIGNNLLTRTNVFVYAAPEPGPTFSGALPLKARWRLRYPNDEPFDAESLLIHKRFGYIIAKELVDGRARVYRFPCRPRGGGVSLEPQCELDVGANVSGADLTRDGKRLAIITRAGAYLFQLPGSIPAAGQLIPSLFVPFELDRMEGCCFTRDGLLVTAESGEILLFTQAEFKTPRRR